MSNPLGRPGERIDAHALRRAMRPLSIQEVERRAGLPQTTLNRVLRTGGCYIPTLDAVCGALGIHETEILA